jgi:hypothetical protein
MGDKPKIEFYTSSDIMQTGSFGAISDLYGSYVDTLKVLHKKIKNWPDHFQPFHTLVVGAMSDSSTGPAYDPNPLILPNSTIIVFGVVAVDGKPKVVTTVQANLIISIPKNSVLVSNVVTHKKFQNLGFGRMAMEFLDQYVREYWLNNGEIKLFLTNSPKKENADFYLKSGYTARDESGGDPTVVWEKSLERIS